jgi:hypothetical protein
MRNWYRRAFQPSNRRRLLTSIFEIALINSGFALKDSVYGFRRDVAMGFAVEQCWRVLSIVNNDIDRV